MSKNITIQEGGVAKQMTADKLKTNLVGGGSCLWVPEDERGLGTKHISEDGTYRASDDGYYGYSEVTVNGIGTATGKDPDGSGDEATASVDPDTGDIVITKVPSSISVVTPPTNPYGIYQNGQTIGKDGMVVKAYLESGGEYGTVPNGAIALNPTTAVYDASTDRPGGYITDGGEIAEQFPSYAEGVNFPIQSSGNVSTTSSYWDNTYSGEHIFATSVGSSGCTLWACSKNVSHITRTSRPHREPSETPGQDIIDEIPISARASFNNEIFYVNQVAQESGQPNYSYTGPAAVTGNTTFIAYCILFGDTTETRAGSHQTINVSWPRPGDGKVLETTFEIIVQSNLGGATGGGGEAGDNGAGRND